MKLLLIEDEIKERNLYEKIEKSKTDVEFVAMTGSADDGIRYVKQYMPEGIILDLELNKDGGSGTGFSFIEELNKLKITNRPKIVVTTNVCSDTVYDFLHKNGVEFIFYKKQNNYSQESVINTLLLLQGYTNTTIQDIKEDDDNNENIISKMIEKELNLIGVSTHMQGRKYLYDAIYYAIENNDNEGKATVTQNLVKKYKKPSSTIIRAMQNSIIRAWRVSSIEDLSTYYTARINYETGVPTPTEFIYYYADKIKKEI